MDTTEALGRVIAAHRIMLGQPRKWLAEQAGISYPYICEIENGTKEASLTTLAGVARALGVQLSVLLARAERLIAGDCQL